MDIIKEDYGLDFIQIFTVQPPKGGTQFVGVGILAIDHYDHLFAIGNVVVDVSLDVATGIGHLAVLGKLIIMPLIEEGHELFVIIQNVPFILGNPVYIHLIWVK